MTVNDIQPLVSIVISSYNHEKYIIDCLKGVYSQDYEYFEVIIRDDGSTDNTPALIQGFLSNTKNTNNIHTVVDYGKNIGIIKSLNCILTKASGDIVMCCGSDDIFLPQRIKYAVELHQRYYNIDLVACNGQVISDNGDLIRQSFYKQAGDLNINNPEVIEFKELEYKTAMNFELAGFGISYNKNLLKSVNYQFPETLLYEDGFESFLGAVQNGAILFYKPLIKYRRANNSISRIDPNLSEKEILEKENKFLELFLSLELSKYDYLKKNLYVNEIIHKNKILSLHYLEQKILFIKLKKDTIEDIFNWRHWLKLLFTINKKGVEQKKIAKMLILYFLRKKFKVLIIREYKCRGDLL